MDDIGIQPDSRVLEIGCGTGLNFKHILKRLHPDKGQLVGVDFSSHMLNKAQKRVDRHQWQNIELAHGDATKLTLEQPCDRVLFAYTLSMIPDVDEALKCAVGNLRPGGKILVLDFGRFEGWGPGAPLMRGFLHCNHVRILENVERAMAKHCQQVRLRRLLGGHHIIAVGVK